MTDTMTAERPANGRRPPYQPADFETIVRERTLYGWMNFHETALALGMRFSHAKRLLEEGRFPIEVDDHTPRGSTRETLRVPIARVWTHITGQEVPVPTNDH